MKLLSLQEIHRIVTREVEQRISQTKTKLIKTIESEKELMEFEILCSLLVKPQKRIHNLIEKERAKAWKESLKKAKGNKEKAIEIFDEIYLK